MEKRVKKEKWEYHTMAPKGTKVFKGRKENQGVSMNKGTIEQQQ